MKKLLTAIALVISLGVAAPAEARDRDHRGGGHGWNHGKHWKHDRGRVHARPYYGRGYYYSSYRPYHYRPYYPVAYNYYYPPYYSSWYAPHPGTSISFRF